MVLSQHTQEVHQSLVVVVVVVEENNMNNTSCQLCHKELFNEIGKACKTCGMILSDEGKDFCSKLCRSRYIKIKGNI